MPVLDWNFPAGLIIDWGAGSIAYVPPPDIERLYLHALTTSTLFHAEATAGESTPASVTYNIGDGAGNRLVDEDGNYITAAVSEQAILIHAKETNTLFHAEK